MASHKGLPQSSQRHPQPIPGNFLLILLYVFYHIYHYLTLLYETCLLPVSLTRMYTPRGEILIHFVLHYVPAHRRTSINTYWVNSFADSMYPLGSTGEHVLCYKFYYQHCEVLENLVLPCSPVPPPCFPVLTGDTKWRKVTQSASRSVSDQSCLTILRSSPHLKRNQPGGRMSNGELKDDQEKF